MELYRRGTIITGDGPFVAAGAYLRGGLYLGTNCIVGPNCEIKNSVILSESKLEHVDFVGESLIGHISSSALWLTCS
ncbi:LbetaH domain-containing protein [Pseudomonas californiensis]|nr:hypothetical protein [Pseudomonas californiensis]